MFLCIKLEIDLFGKLLLILISARILYLLNLSKNNMETVFPDACLIKAFILDFRHTLILAILKK